MSFGIYAIAYLILILIVGVCYLASRMHILQNYIVAGVVILVGIGIIPAVRRPGSMTQASPGRFSKDQESGFSSGNLYW
jgi:hypothetical protein